MTTLLHVFNVQIIMDWMLFRPIQLIIKFGLWCQWWVTTTKHRFNITIEIRLHKKIGMHKYELKISGWIIEMKIKWEKYKKWFKQVDYFSKARFLQTSNLFSINHSLFRPSFFIIFYFLKLLKIKRVFLNIL